MWPKLLRVLAIYLLYIKLCNGQNERRCEVQSTCNGCIQEFGCVWCSNPNDFDETRCRAEIEVEKSKWCPPGKLTKPQQQFAILQDNPFNDGIGKGKKNKAVQLKPQKVKLRLRRGEEFRLPFQYSKAANYPVDLYYLMDLSRSMLDHKKALAHLGNRLAEVMRNITTDFRLGFGSFVDKVGHPFVNMHPAQIKPCSSCVRAYNFKNHLPLTSDYKQFSLEVSLAPISTNLDYPEGGFDALIQAIVCKKEIGWREAARHLVIFSTDADSHIAGDGRLVGAFRPNDGKCHLKKNEYSQSLKYDYPSVSFLNHVAKENNINLILAITPGSKRVFRLYNQLITSGELENTEIGRLNTTNIVSMVAANYKKIASTVRITANASKSIEIKYESSCKQSDTCSDIRHGDVVNFTAVIKPTECLSETIQFKPEGVAESLLVELEVECKCDCENPDHPDYVVSSPFCSNHGNKTCGMCQCDSYYFGGFCECNKETTITNDETACKQDVNSTVVCSNAGDCKCGTCICDKYTSGKYCECNNYSCKKVKGLLCSGEDHGKCECGKCKCAVGWKGDDCSCLDDENLCTPPRGDRRICSGHGDCICGQCKCHKGGDNYFGQYCEECPSCEGQRCQELRPCVECQVFKSGKYNQTECKSKCTEFDTIIVDKIQDDDQEIKICSVFDDVSCTIFFQYQYESENQLIVEVQKERRCYEPLNLYIIGSSILGSVIVVGLITLIIWKIVTSIHDRLEYEKFEEERMQSKWHRRDNPLYVGASSTFQNPTYRK